jgi:hypothetical protein
VPQCSRRHSDPDVPSAPGDGLKHTHSIAAAETVEDDSTSVLSREQDAIAGEDSEDRLDANRAQLRLKRPEPLAE